MFVYLMSVFTYSMLFTPKMGKRLDKRVCPERILQSCFSASALCGHGPRGASQKW